VYILINQKVLAVFIVSALSGCSGDSDDERDTDVPQAQTDVSQTETDTGLLQTETDTNASPIEPVQPPQGYLRFDYSIAEPTSWNGDKDGFFSMEYPLRLNDSLAQKSGTFWANDFSFRYSDMSLPDNHVGGDQGGYVGVQILNSDENIAIFSIWGAVSAEAGAGGSYCLNDIEAWYTDDDPFSPPIADLNSTDPNRQVAGGGFWSCRLPIALEANTNYKLRTWVISGNGDRWGAWFINTDTGEEWEIGEIQLPESWHWLNSQSGGFIEHFGPMPNGCDSIPSSDTTYFSPIADDGTNSSISANLYGACVGAVSSRTNIDCNGAFCNVSISD